MNVLMRLKENMDVMVLRIRYIYISFLFQGLMPLKITEIVPAQILLRIVGLSEDEKKLEQLVLRGERLLVGSLAPSLDERPYEDVCAQISGLLEQYKDGRFATYFRERFEALGKKEEQVFK